jgi:NAD(P)-dependent dehydrogenase (short-subunit alcohol dehydrogenase family)
MTPDRLGGLVAVVTGGGSGIGAACARRFAAEGASVMIADLDPAAAASVAAELGDRGASCAVDVRDEAQVEAMVAATTARFGRLDLALNAAGLGTHAAVVDHDLEQWRLVLDVCLTGVFLCTKHEARVMQAQGAGVVINIASINATVPADGMSAYCAAKAGVAMFTQTAGMELAEHGVRVVGLAPGYVETPLTSFARMLPQMHDAYVESIPAGRAGQPDDVAAFAAFLASPEASWITATTMVVDGGESTKAYPVFRTLF